LLHDLRENGGRRREIEEAIAAGAELRVVLVEAFFEALKRCRIVEVARDVTNTLGEIAPQGVARFAAVRESVDGLFHVGAIVVVRAGRAGETDDAEVGGKHVFEAKVVHRRQQHAFGEIAARAEENNVAGFDDAVVR
jgi:hypothetical protein